MYKIGVIVPFFDGNKFMSKLLESIAVTNINYDVKIIIVDNSTDGNRFDINQYRQENLILLLEKQSLGYARACNIGFTLCKEMGIAIAFIVNQDGYFSKGSFEYLVDLLIANDNISVLTPVFYKYETEEIENFYDDYYLGYLKDFRSFRENSIIQPVIQVEKLWGACFALKTAHFTTFQYLFNDLFFMYFEDEDLMIRLSRLNNQVYISTNSFFHHRHSHASDREFEKISITIQRKVSNYLFRFKHSKLSVLRQLPGWMFLVSRIMLSKLFSFKFKDFKIELISVLKVLLKLIDVDSIRIYEEKVIQNYLRHTKSSS